MAQVVVVVVVVVVAVTVVVVRGSELCKPRSSATVRKVCVVPCSG